MSDITSLIIAGCSVAVSIIAIVFATSRNNRKDDIQIAENIATMASEVKSIHGLLTDGKVTMEKTVVALEHHKDYTGVKFEEHAKEIHHVKERVGKLEAHAGV